MAEPDQKYGFKFERGINIQTVIAVILILIGIVVGWSDTQNDIEILTGDLDVIEAEYVSEEQLQYIVVERIDRLEIRLEERLLALELKLQEQLNRIEEKIDQ